MTLQMPMDITIVTRNIFNITAIFLHISKFYE